MKLKHGGGPPRMVFTATETELLGEVLQAVKEEITAGSEGTDADNRVTERLFPAAYEDPEQAGEFRRLTENGLRDERLERLDGCTDELAQTGGTVALTGPVADRWIRVLNDARLILGTRLQVSEQWDHELHPDDPEVSEKAVYLWLSAVQETVVDSLG